MDITLYHIQSEPGTTKENQDTYIETKINEYHIFAIADGVGGLPNGQKASQTAIDQLLENLKTNINQNTTKIITNINNHLLQENTTTQTIMATTLLVCIINSKNYLTTISHVGNTRAYIINNNVWKTKDHTLVQDLVDLGIITNEEARAHPEKNRLKQALGSNNEIKIDTHVQNAEKSTILLCSDGITDYISEQKIFQIAQEPSPKKINELLNNEAKNNQSSDDRTLITIKT